MATETSDAPSGTLPAPRTGPPAEPAPAHPEEIRGSFDLRIGSLIRLQGTGRLTPAGLVCLGICAAASLLATAVLVRAGRR
ncbi:hypothetical protein J2X65_002974 [Ancylobacter sp. 3268]|uniref:hypothetical protein n=1 Tax=Ancylobacter sp. 3268 TaxID=2817752 RepID=UPI00285F00FE|nr:hypothetical protein [Ancylobacter sp. 3268]MDR6953613.1 hypothetical protein [Ancylobacter sp. 3268]